MAKLLIAEDEAVLRMLIVDTLEDEGYAIDTAADGEEALQLLQTQQYDFVVLDHMMPKLTGFEVLSQVRQMPAHQHTKILILSAKSQQAEQERAIAMGANAFMAKPFSPAELARKIEELLHG